MYRSKISMNPKQKNHEENHKAHYNQISENQGQRENLKSGQCEKLILHRKQR